MKKFPAHLAGTAIANLFKKPFSVDYPRVERPTQPGFRGRLSYKPDLCTACNICVKACPAQAISITNAGYREAPRYECTLDLGRCLQCGQCAADCPNDCLKLTNEPLPPLMSRHELKVVL